MKKLLSALFLISMVSTLCAQNTTVYYRKTESVDQNGQRSQGSGGMYITFTDNGFYESDANGYKKSTPMNTFMQYQGKDNGIYVFFEYYQLSADWYNFATGQMMEGIKRLIAQWYFSEDYEKLNVKDVFITNSTAVYRKAISPSEGLAPPSGLY